MNRRTFIRGLIAAPAVVAASSLMPVVRSIERLLAPTPPFFFAWADAGTFEIIGIDGGHPQTLTFTFVNYDPDYNEVVP